MPDILTHMIFGQDLADKIVDKKLRNSFTKYKKLFLFGCQGPDFLFYHKFLRFRRFNSINEMGTLLHNQNTHMFFRKGFKRMMSLKKYSPEYLELFYYLLGFLSHYYLDKTVHPYVYYIAGVHDSNKPETLEYFTYHQKVEMIFDSILYESRYNKRVTGVKIHKLIDTGKGLPLTVKHFLKDTINTLYERNASYREIDHAYSDMKLAFRILYDPWGIKKKIFTAFFRLLGYKSIPGRPFHTSKYDKTLDYMNLKNAIWNHPADPGETYTYSFYDLYKKALIDASDTVMNISKNESYDEDFFSDMFSQSISYTTGKPYASDPGMKHFKCIFKNRKNADI